MMQQQVAHVQHIPQKASWLEKLKKRKNAARKMNGWLLGETLGMGGYSKVKLGINEQTGMRAALKIMFADPDSGTMSASKKKQLDRELAVMQRVKHKNVIQLIEYDDQAEYPANNGSKIPCICVVLEFAPGGELFDYLMFTGRFDEMASRTYFHQFIAGLDAIHMQGICHRDLKPENLLLDNHCNLKIADFGFATEFKTSDGMVKKMQTACGTKGYLAPELLKGKKYTHLCDIFAVGIIMFTTFAGFPPFQNAVETDWWWDKLSKGWKYLEQAKRLQLEKDIMKHRNAGVAKKELFWKAHERTVTFPPAFKYLIEYTLHPMPSCRYDIGTIRQDAWYNGPQYNQEQLQVFLSARVDKVRKERVDKIKKQVQDGPENYGSGVGAKRPLNASGDALPEMATPSMEFMVRAKQIDPQQEFELGMDVLGDNEAFTHSLYKFLTVCPPAVTAARVEHAAVQTSANFTVDPVSNLIIVETGVTFGSKTAADVSETVRFAIKQFAKEGAKDDEGRQVYEVCFKRLMGSHQAYKKAAEEFFFSKELLYAML